MMKPNPTPRANPVPVVQSPKAISSTTLSDFELMEIIKQLELDQKYAHLLIEVHSLLCQVNESTNYKWKFRSINGESYWINTEKNTTSTSYPYLDAVRSELK